MSFSRFQRIQYRKFSQFQLIIVFKIQNSKFRITDTRIGLDSQKYDWHKYFRDISKLGKFTQFQLLYSKFKKFRITEFGWIFKRILKFGFGFYHVTDINIVFFKITENSISYVSKIHSISINNIFKIQNSKFRITDFESDWILKNIQVTKYWFF